MSICISVAELFEKLVAMVQLAKKVEQASRLPLSGSKRNACATLEEASSVPTEKSIRVFMEDCAARNLGEKLLRLTADSPDLFAVIKQEGKV